MGEVGVVEEPRMEGVGGIEESRSREVDGPVENEACDGYEEDDEGDDDEGEHENEDEDEDEDEDKPRSGVERLTSRFESHVQFCTVAVKILDIMLKTIEFISSTMIL